MNAAASTFAGRKVLIVEDETIVSMLIEDMLVDQGAEVLYAGNVADALAHLANGRPDAAVLDVNLGRENAFPVAERLAAEGVPFVFSTGYGGSVLPPAWADRPVVQKPYAVESLCALLARELDGRASP